ncbi:DUF4329 domain-containing protein [Octadecabacter sp. G9-8]|uniref:DUF4329 domain-containing protein n=1 Tax=Octadecabacter dasysiphoniae TaxID=2909341 RepID=A0ABS9D163_9RHOB|nr:DUF4329 domain-containing protein [Octadecabacter dasysiphoniae]MCF2872782.1 DUF4329 domain-containing protein [Octadecabacter dasysiphoniae]
MIRLTALFAAASLALAGCDAPSGQTFTQPSPSGLSNAPRQENVGFSVAPANAPSGPTVDAFAARYLDTLQARSFSGRREYCGYFFVDTAGRLQATPPRAGNFASCLMPEPRVGQGIIASYHTHGSFAAAYDNEVPSVVDLESDFDYGIDGYVSTPGGRVWLVDFQTFSTRQVCGLGCIRSDPQFRPQNEGNIRQSYTYTALQQRSRGFGS